MTCPASRKRVQCAKCPWKTSTNPHDIPGGYSVEKHKALKATLSEGLAGLNNPVMRVMGCHEFSVGVEQACVGWLANQLGPGNNLALRLRAMTGDVDTNFELVGEQHRTLEDTLPDGAI